MAEINTIYINGTDSTALFKKRSIPVSSEFRYGPNGGTMLSGRQIVDVLAEKEVRTRSYKPLTEAQVRAHLANLRTNTGYINVTVCDETTGNLRSFDASYTVPTRTYRFTDSNGTKWFTLSDLVFEEL